GAATTISSVVRNTTIYATSLISATVRRRLQPQAVRFALDPRGCESLCAEGSRPRRRLCLSLQPTNIDMHGIESVIAGPIREQLDADGLARTTVLDQDHTVIE